LFGCGRINIAAYAFNRELLGLKTQPAELASKKITDRALIASDRLDIHELTREGDNIHAQEDTSNADAGVPARASLLLCLSPSHQ